MFARMTVLAATLDPRALVPVTPVDADGLAWFAIVDSVKPVDPDTVGNPDDRDYAAREAAAIRTGGMRLIPHVDGHAVVSARAISPIGGSVWLAISGDSYPVWRVPVGECFPCLDAIRYA